MVDTGLEVARPRANPNSLGPLATSTTDRLHTNLQGQTIAKRHLPILCHLKEQPHR